MNTREDIDRFYSSRTLAVFGYSDKKSSFSKMATSELALRGYSIVGVNPKATPESAPKCYPSLGQWSETNGAPDAALIVVNPTNSLAAVREAIGCGVKSIWIQQTSSSIPAEEECNRNGVSLVSGKCVLMYMPRTAGIHKLHKAIWSLFGLTVK